MDQSVVPLAAGFEPASEARWRELVERTLKGAAAESLISEAADIPRLRPLYAAADAARPLPFTPVVRGAQGAWDVRAVIDRGEPAAARARVADDLNGGASSLLVKIDPSGRSGVAIGSGTALAALLDEMALEKTPVALDAGFLGLAAAGWLAAIAKASPEARLHIDLDPISAFASSGESPGPIESHLIAGAELAAHLIEPHPKARLFLASGRVVHEAGGGPAWELAVMAAAAVAYAKALVRAGLPMPAAFAGVTLGLTIDGDVLVSIAKLRAARVLWAAITSACDAEATAVIEARSSMRMLVATEPWANLVRLTASGFAGAAGGADAIVLGAFTDASGPATAFARRLARNTQLILMEEARVGAVADPAAGAWAFEALTADLAERAWRCFTAIEAAGGLVDALRDGLIAAEVAAAREGLRAKLKSGEMKIVGVTDFRHVPGRMPPAEGVQADSVQAPDPRLPGPDSHCPPLVPTRLETLAA